MKYELKFRQHCVRRGEVIAEAETAREFLTKMMAALEAHRFDNEHFFIAESLADITAIYGTDPEDQPDWLGQIKTYPVAVCEGNSGTDILALDSAKLTELDAERIIRSVESGIGDLVVVEN